MILTIAGGSGSGKSAFANTLETDLIDLNTDQDIVILDFSFEMLSYRQIGRKLSNRLRRTTSELYSANDSIDDATLDKVKEEAEKIKKYQIFYIDTPSTVESIEKTIDYFHETIAKDKWLIVILDMPYLQKAKVNVEQQSIYRKCLFVKRNYLIRVLYRFHR